MEERLLTRLDGMDEDKVDSRTLGLSSVLPRNSNAFDPTSPGHGMSTGTSQTGDPSFSFASS